MQPDEARCSTKTTAMVPGRNTLLEESGVMADDNQSRYLTVVASGGPFLGCTSVRL